ncbi:TfoX/Sxy family protein [Vagococcus sp. BWB3-3]|uniref:TfoX/Sxy family protein n=1 Tax=Vagococcus allomyrinae TaxID=2794353 RepID=A0A940SXQ9_9ENTE|nr:TfoX/Sxy family protein [Vagococcus allomyrinae]
MEKLSSLPNIGTTIEKKLNAVGVHSAEQLKDLGSRGAFIKLKAFYPEVCLVHLYCLQGAIESIAYNKLPEMTKKELKKFADAY